MGVASRYARAIFELAREEGRVAEVGGELRLIEGLLDDMPGLKAFFSGVVYGFKAKRDVLEGIYTTLSISRLTINFLLLLIKKNRMQTLPEIIRIYERLEDEEEGRERIKVILPKDRCEGSLLERIKARLKEVTGKEVLITVKEDKDILGGIIVKIGDIVIDGSVRSRLLKIGKNIREGV